MLVSSVSFLVNLLLCLKASDIMYFLFEIPLGPDGVVLSLIVFESSLKTRRCTAGYAR